MLAGALLLEHVGEMEAGKRVRDGVTGAIRGGIRTRDLGGHATTRQFGEAVAARVAG
jgi:isocitrate/isopropylmalate dehydrogenase